MTRPGLPVNTAGAPPRRRGGARGTCGASGSPPQEQESTADLASAPLLIDSREVARLLGIGRTKTFLLMASGELPTIRLGRSVRVPVVALQSWIAGKTESADD
jgi:excisionase family DNA binding protein